MTVFDDDTRRDLEDEARAFLAANDQRQDWQTAARELREAIVDLARIVDVYERRIAAIEARLREDA